MYEQIRKDDNQWIDEIEKCITKAAWGILRIDAIKNRGLTTMDDIKQEADLLICEMFKRSKEENPHYTLGQNIGYIIKYMPMRLRDNIYAANNIRYCPNVAEKYSYELQGVEWSDDLAGLPNHSAEDDFIDNYVSECNMKEYLSHLPEKQAQVISLRYNEDLTSKQIADLTGLTVGTVNVYTNLAYKNIRKQITA